MKLFILGAVFFSALTDRVVAEHMHEGSATELLDLFEKDMRQPGSSEGLVCYSKTWSVQATIATLAVITPNFKRPYCLPSTGWSNEQAVRIFVKYAGDHPDQLHLPAEFIIILSLQNSFPCP